MLFLLIICIPVFLNNSLFLLGFVSCLSLFLAGLILFILFRKKNIGKQWLTHFLQNKQSLIPSRLSINMTGVALTILVLGALTTSVLLFKRNNLIQTQIEYQSKLIEQKTELIEANRKRGLVQMMSSLLEKVDSEVNVNPNRELSDETISRLASLSYSFESDSYDYLKLDSLSENGYSLERGQLLMALTQIPMSDNSFNKIKRKVSFAGADLAGADLKGLNLNWVDLRNANLKDADLSKAQLNESVLSGAYLWGSKLRKTQLNSATLKRVDLRWADLTEVTMNEAVLNGSDMSNAKMEKSSLIGAQIQWANLSGASLIDANLECADLFGAVLKMAKLDRINLSDAPMSLADLSYASLIGANLSGARLRLISVSKVDWLDHLIEWEINGAKEIIENYRIEKSPREKDKYVLELIGD
jgi:uncharacterized protein YjbI with pentapeptide repeats